MKITKYGHCCMLVEDKGVRILTDPGSFTADTHAALTNVDVVLYTHEHADHYHLASLKQLLVSNPSLVIICGEGVSALLAAEGIKHTILSDGSYEHNGVSIIGITGLHEEVHSSIPRIRNTGFMISARLWYPGDAFIDPKRAIEILALPVAGPWMKVSQAIDYAIALKPKTAFPVHDMILHPQFAAFVPAMVGDIVGTHGISFTAVELGKEYDF